MPFKSQAQRAFMYAEHPEMAKKWEKETPKGKKLPKKVKKAEFGMYEDELKKVPTLQPQPISSASLAAPSATVNPTKLGSDYEGAKKSVATTEAKNKMGMSRPNPIALGPMIQGGLAAINAFLPEDQPRKYIDQTLAYNPYPQGTGSQALYEEGGVILLEEDPKPKKSKASRKAKNNVIPEAGYENSMKYNGIVDANGQVVNEPTQAQWLDTMIKYANNNTPESNVYRPDFQHHSINLNVPPVPNDIPAYAEFGIKLEDPTKPKKSRAQRKANNSIIPEAGYENKMSYNGIVDESGKVVHEPTQAQWLDTMIKYANNNTPESNVYRDNFQHHSINLNTPPTPNDYPTYAKNGAKIQAVKSTGLQVHKGGNAPELSYNPIDGGTGEFTGNSHADNGVLATYNGKPFEAEGGEPYRIDSEGSLEIFGNLKNPFSGNKFKKDAKVLAYKEKKAQKFIDRGNDLVIDNPTKDKFDVLKFNAGEVMLKGGLSKQKELAQAKDELAFVQQIMLDEKSNKMKKGGKIEMYPEGGKPGDPDPKYAEAIKKYAAKYGVNPSTISKIIATESGFNPNAVSNVGAKGIMQFMPKTAKAYGLTDKSAPEEHIEAGVKHFASLLKQNHGDEKLAVAAYNMGQGNLMDFVKSSGKKLKDYTGADLEQRLDWKNKNQPSKKGNLAQNQTRKYLKTIFGEDAGPEQYEQFRQEFYGEAPKNPLTNQEYTFNAKYNPRGPKAPGTPLPVAPNQEFTPVTEAPYQKRKNGLPWSQIAPAIPQVFDTVDYVEGQYYNPELKTPYQVSFQDRVNQNSKTFNAVSTMGRANPEALSVLAAQQYQANDAVLADEFRTNQGISNTITNENIGILNDAKLKNIQLADSQYTRQAQAKANTEDRRIGAGIQIGDVLAKNALENKTLDVTSQLYKNYAFDDNMQLKYVGQENAGDRLADVGTNSYGANTRTDVITSNPNQIIRQRYEKPDWTLDKADILKGYRKRKTIENGGKLTQGKISKMIFS